VLFAIAALWIGQAPSFWVLLAAMVVIYPAGGAFVSLSQAALMDQDPTRHEQNMARWGLAGDMGSALGPLALSAAVALGLGWRGLFAVFSVLALALGLVVSRLPVGGAASQESEPATWRGLARG